MKIPRRPKETREIKDRYLQSKLRLSIPIVYSSLFFFPPVYNRLIDISGVKVGGIHPKNAIFRVTREEKKVNMTTTLLEKSEKRAQI